MSSLEKWLRGAASAALSLPVIPLVAHVVVRGFDPQTGVLR